MKNIFYTAVIIFSLVTSPIVVGAQVASGGNFTLEQSVIAGGGGQNSTGGQFTLDGTIGQAAAGGELSNSMVSVTSGFWNFTGVAQIGFEGDVASRPNGDGFILSDDVVQVRRFFIGLDSPNPSLNEFQRADSGPFATRGNGLLLSDDIVQTRRYQIGLDLPQGAGGPTAAAQSSAPVTVGKALETESPAVAPRELRVESASASPGQPVTVNLKVDAQGDESEYGFTLTYDAAKLLSPTTGAGTTGASVRSCNTAISGQIRCSVGGFPNDPNNNGIGEIAAGNDQTLLTVSFTVAANAPGGTTPLTLSTVNTSNDAAQLLAISSTNGTVTILAPTAANVTVSGRVMTQTGRGIRNVVVTMTDSQGNVRIATSTSFGYYQFDAVAAGETYIFTARAKRFTFGQNTIVQSIMEDTNNINFVAADEKRL